MLAPDLAPTAGFATSAARCGVTVQIIEKASWECLMVIFLNLAGRRPGYKQDFVSGTHDDDQWLIGPLPREDDIMKTAVLVEKLGKNKYRASTSQPIALESEGRSRDEAIKRLCMLARKRLAAGEWQEVSLPGPPPANPWVAYAGIWKDHPDLGDFLKNIADYRRARNGPDAAS
jgi:hypothetical protein